MGIRFQILQQEEEGKLGFFTAKTLFPRISDEALLAWDSGNGSFQIAASDKIKKILPIVPDWLKAKVVSSVWTGPEREKSRTWMFNFYIQKFMVNF